MRLIDITVPIRPSMAVWPGDPAPERKLLSSIDAGDAANVSVLTLGVHTGTHIDAPRHFVKDGYGVEDIPLDALVGPVQVIEILGDGHVTAEKLEMASIRPDTVRLIIKTRNTVEDRMHRDDFHREFAAVSGDGAKWIVDRGVKFVGVDYLSVEPFKNPGHPTHMALLSANVAVLEGCDLSLVSPGNYTLVCAPMKIAGSDGAPARVYLLSE